MTKFVFGKEENNVWEKEIAGKRYFPNIHLIAIFNIWKTWLCLVKPFDKNINDINIQIFAYKQSS